MSNPETMSEIVLTPDELTALARDAEQSGCALTIERVGPCDVEAVADGGEPPYIVRVASNGAGEVVSVERREIT